jgi:hypothetical protein
MNRRRGRKCGERMRGGYEKMMSGRRTIVVDEFGKRHLPLTHAFGLSSCIYPADNVCSYSRSIDHAENTDAQDERYEVPHPHEIP